MAKRKATFTKKVAAQNRAMIRRAIEPMTKQGSWLRAALRLLFHWQAILSIYVKELTWKHLMKLKKGYWLTASHRQSWNHF